MTTRTTPRITGCIPARYASTRLPGKPLCDIGGKPMILHVVEKARRARHLTDVVVLTDDPRIIEVVEAAGHHAVMTSEHCASGTDRIAEYLQRRQDTDIVVNIQGDEVMLDPRHIDHLIEGFLQQDAPRMGTLAHRCSDPAVLSQAANVKVVTAHDRRALYFSRQCIPVRQDGALPDTALIHIGIYIYTRQTLDRLMRLPRSPLEKTESLEQLRALENGIDITVVTLDDYDGLAVDTPEDLQQARQRLQER